MSEEGEIEARSVRVSNFLVKKDKVSALAASLQNPPVNEKSEDLKERNLAIVESVISVISESEIPAMVKALDMDTCDVLMKYVYKLMSKPKASYSAILLKIHAQLVEKAGLGSIVRVMTDRKQV